MNKPYVIGIRFEEVSKIYYFDAGDYPELQPNDYVIVKTGRGLQLAKVELVDVNDDTFDKSAIKKIERPATPRDMALRQILIEKEKRLYQAADQYFRDERLDGLKIAKVEYSLDGARVLLQVSYEGEGHFNLKKAQHDLQGMMRDAQLEIRQVGPRDVAKALGGMGACGLEKRCCTAYLDEFQSISIKMAKAQDISLTPPEITGMCGRLRCCLIYEYEQYEEARKSLPKRKKRVLTPLGEGRVIQVLPMHQSVIVDLPEIGPRQFTKAELDKAENPEKYSAEEAPIKVEEEDVDISQFLDDGLNKKPIKTEMKRPDRRPPNDGRNNKRNQNNRNRKRSR